MQDLHAALEHHRRGELAAAARLYRRCLAQQPDDPDALRLLGVLERDRGALPEALDLLRRACDAKPGDPAARSDLVAAIKAAPSGTLDASWDGRLRSLLLDPAVDPRHVARAALSAARRLGLQAPLVRVLLATAPVADTAVEAGVTELRRRLLEAPDSLDPELAACVALQTFHCDYAHWSSDEELAAVDAIFTDPSRRSLCELTALAAYRRLSELPDAAEVADRHGATADDPRQAVVHATLLQPLAERQLAAALPRLAPVTDAVSTRVQAQYEEHPYPRWSRLGALRRAPLARALELRVPEWKRPTSWPERPQVLVAGCGTGSNPLQIAVPHPETDIVGVDLSLASLGHAARKTLELGVTNLTLMHGDLLDLPTLGRSFDYIECGGVLHHMRDPIAGWKTLASMLAPGGMMKIGLYSERARRLIVEARQIIAQEGYGADTAGVRRFRRDLIAGASPALVRLSPLRRWRDFYTLGECRDLLFHVQEHRFTPQSLDAAMQTLGLEFLGFDRGPAPARSLARWEEYEQDHPDAFEAMFVFHCRAR